MAAFIFRFFLACRIIINAFPQHLGGTWCPPDKQQRKERNNIYMLGLGIYIKSGALVIHVLSLVLVYVIDSAVFIAGALQGLFGEVGASWYGSRITRKCRRLQHEQCMCEGSGLYFHVVVSCTNHAVRGLQQTGFETPAVTKPSLLCAMRPWVGPPIGFYIRSRNRSGGLCLPMLP